MFETDILTLIIVALFASVIIYRISYLNKKSIGYLSLTQIIYLVIIPGFVYTLSFSYLKTILARPLNNTVIIPDGLLVNGALLSLLFTYGGIAIHAVTKMLAHLESVRYSQSDAREMIRYFHQKFSHNLVYAGGISTFLCFTLLELNHVAPLAEQNIFWALSKGLILGISSIMAMYWYTVSKDEYIGKWSDLKTVFLVFWFGFILIIYGIHKTNPSLREYQLILPLLTSFSLIAFLNFVLVLRRIKRGGFRIYLRLGKIKQILFEVKDNENSTLEKKNNPQSID